MGHAAHADVAADAGAAPGSGQPASATAAPAPELAEAGAIETGAAASPAAGPQPPWPAYVGHDVRVDKWLWAARMFKTRSAAGTACSAGHIKVNGASVKPAKPVRVGDRIEALTAGGLRILDVAKLDDRRGPAPVAQALYIDHTPPPPPRDPAELALIRERGLGRPSKRDRRRLDRLRGW